MPFVKKIIRKFDRYLFKRDRINHNILNKYKTIYTNKIIKREKKIKNISVIVPCYNHSKYLYDALSSIIKQTRVPDEIILIDDNSNDSTFNILKQFYKDNQNILKIILRKNKYNLGQSATINIGVSIAKSDLIMILNDDDYLMHDAIEHTLDIFNSKTDIYLLGSKSLYFYKQEHFENLKKMTFGLLE